ncbi:MAG: cupredoxin domain-containing protein [Dehalococcoidales bacterium]|nr:cupredoxin domain-containing protein [Dehalococcoidales bacterium]
MQLAADAIAFDKNVLTVPAGSQVTLVFNNNEDPVIFHNVAVYTTRAAGEPVMVGEFIPGGASITYQFTAPSTPGTYYFRCDIHPLAMNGDFIVE